MRHVLIVDSEPAISSLVSTALETEEGCRCSAATTAYDALALLARDRPDAAIIEAVMPDVSGIAIAGQVLAGGIPVLMMTGEPATQTLFGAYGIPFLAKPFHIGDLRSAWRRLLSDPTERHAELTDQIALLVFDVRQTARSLNSSRENLARVVAALR